MKAQGWPYIRGPWALYLGYTVLGMTVGSGGGRVAVPELVWIAPFAAASAARGLPYMTSAKFCGCLDPPPCPVIPLSAFW